MLRQITVAAAAVCKAMRTTEGKVHLDALDKHERVCRGQVSNPYAWHVEPYSHRGYRPTYHVRKFDAREGAGRCSRYGISTSGSARLAGVIAMLMNAYEVVTGQDLIDWLHDDDVNAS